MENHVKKSTDLHLVDLDQDYAIIKPIQSAEQVIPASKIFSDLENKEQKHRIIRKNRNRWNLIIPMSIIGGTASVVGLIFCIKKIMIKIRQSKVCISKLEKAIDIMEEEDDNEELSPKTKARKKIKVALRVAKEGGMSKEELKTLNKILHSMEENM